MNEEPKKPNRVMLLAAVMSIGLVVIKAVIFFVSGSMIVFASLLDSLADSIISFTNHKVHKLAREEADVEHPFGHGGYEVVASLIQGIILMFFGFNLIFESSRVLFWTSGTDIDIESLPLTAGILLLSAAGGLIIQRFINRHIEDADHREDRSLAMHADHAHYAGDVAINFAAAVGLIVIYFTGYTELDPIMGIVGAFFLMKAAYPILKQCYYDIVHSRIDPHLQQEIVDIVLSADSRIKGIHQLRSRELGPSLFIDFHMVLPKTISLEHAHTVGDKVEEEIKKKIPRADIVIHLDPDSEEEHESWLPVYKVNQNGKGEVSNRPQPSKIN